MVIQDVMWLGKHISEDSTHRLVTDEQIEKWNRGGVQSFRNRFIRL